ncbi:MFS transporter [Micrococcus antarcticus]|uniref:MFS transporter n=1 Tax=Micrococcus antarcticus TaxID=86171 RepID=UPI002604F4C9|nr:MFS transporter [uncultured Micrococcus sp.]
MDFGAYGRLLQDPRIRQLLMVGFIARFPHTAAGVILTLHVALTLGLGYGQAGLAAAAMTLGIAVGAPWRGRVVDAKGLRRALLPSVVAEALIWPIVPWLPFPWMLLAVFLGGVFALPIFSVVRQGLGVLTHGKDRQTAFALDSIITETIFMMGPALGAVVAATWSSALGLTIVGLSSALGGLLLMWFNPPTRSSQLAVVGPATDDPYTEAEDRDQAVAQSVHGAPMHVEMTAPDLATGTVPLVTGAIPIITGAMPRIAEDGSGPVPQARLGLTRRERLALWREKNFAWVTPEALGVLVVSMAAGIVMVGTEVSMVAELERAGQAAAVGVVYALWCGASAIGGLFYGAWGRQVHPYLLMALFALFTMPMAVVDGLWPLALASIPSGLLTAPTLAAASSRLSNLVVEERRGEAMGFYGSAMTAGAALGAPVAGVFIDAISPAAGYVFAALVGFVLVAVAALATLTRRRRGAAR